MPVFLFLLGILLTGVGLFLIGFSIPFRDFSLGNTLIISGATGIVGGIVVLAIAATLRELRKIARLLEANAIAPRVAPPPVAAPVARPAPPPRPPVRPPPTVSPARPPRAEPRLDASPAEDDNVPEPPPPAAPTVADVTVDRPRGGLFASIRGRSQATPQPPRPVPSLGPSPAGSAPPPGSSAAGPGGPLPDGEDEDRPPPLPRSLRPNRSPLPGHEPGPETPSAPRSPTLAALAARTAARLDLPTRAEPDLPRTAAEPPPVEPPAERLVPEASPEKPGRNLFDSVWPNDGMAPERDDEDTPPQPERKSPEILKSGVIDGMAYTLYTDGSIEAQLPQGTLRFTSIDDLRAHLERGG